MLKIRLRRMGAIRRPHYRIVVADARAPRDGRFIESLGHYNPVTDPATIQVDVTKYEEWKSKGAQPTNAVASLVKQFNRAERKAAAAGEDVPAPSRRTRTASTKGINKAPAAQVAEVEEVDEVEMSEAPDTESTGAATEAEATETSGSHMNEAMAEATRDGGEGSDAIIGESAEEGTSANPGAASEETAETAASEETAPADES